MKLIVGNFKMNLLEEDINNYLAIIRDYFFPNVVFCPSAIYLDLFQKNGLTVGTQDISFEKSGAYTGDISASMYKSIGVTYAIIGHSERRKYYKDDKYVNKKISIALEEGLKPIVCIGETKEEREISINGFLGIGSDKPYTLLGSNGSRFWMEEWEYPNIGIVICDCPSGGHDLVFLDYRDCGPEGVPCVSYVDQEADYEITKIADTFEAFVDGLVIEKEKEVDTSKIILHSTPKLDALIAKMRIEHPERFKK